MIDSDVPHSTNGTRRRLLAALEDGVPQRRLADRARNLVAEQAMSSGADLGTDKVLPLSIDPSRSQPEPIASFVGALLDPPPAFTHGIWSSAALVSKLQAQGRSVAWIPGMLAADAADDVEIRETPRNSDGVVAAALRCDYSPFISLGDLVLFAGSAAEETDEQSVAVGASGDDVWL